MVTPSHTNNDQGSFTPPIMFFIIYGLKFFVSENSHTDTYVVPVNTHRTAVVQEDEMLDPHASRIEHQDPYFH